VYLVGCLIRKEFSLTSEEIWTSTHLSFKEEETWNTVAKFSLQNSSPSHYRTLRPLTTELFALSIQNSSPLPTELFALSLQNSSPYHYRTLRPITTELFALSLQNSSPSPYRTLRPLINALKGRLGSAQRGKLQTPCSQLRNSKATWNAIKQRDWL
jgi:hypothetical protein